MNTFPNARDFLGSLSVSMWQEFAGSLAYERAWDRKVDLNPEEFAEWYGSRVAQAREIAACYYLAVFALLDMFVSSVRCDLNGHLLEDSGCFANGDSAADNYYCRRCGRNFHHTYY